jgi:5-methylcytosine-specific restriction endonuclease McrA
VDTVSKTQLEQWYINERKSTRAIAALLGMSQPWARKLLREHGIKLRTYKDNPIPTPRGSHLSESHRARISESLAGNTNYLDAETGKHFNYQRAIVPCAECGAGIEKRQCHLAKFEKSFCSHACHGRWKSKQIGPFNTKWTSVEMPCAQCGISVTRKAGHAKRSKHAFCSRQCHAVWRSKNQTGETRYNWVGGYEPYYGESWAHAKRSTRERDKHTCQRCGKTRERVGKNMDVHHKTPFRTFGVERHREANALENLICYCARCHKLVECEIPISRGRHNTHRLNSGIRARPDDGRDLSCTLGRK